MHFVKKGIVTAVAAAAVMAIGASGASATITPSSGAVTATNTSPVVLAGGITNTCNTLDFAGSITSSNPTTQGAHGTVTGWTTGGCSPLSPTGTFPWTLEVTQEIGGGLWNGTITGVNVTIGGICHFTGALNVQYNNGTGILSLRTPSGTLTGSPSFPCGNASVSGGSWDLKVGGVTPVLS